MPIKKQYIRYFKGTFKDNSKVNKAMEPVIKHAKEKAITLVEENLDNQEKR